MSKKRQENILFAAFLAVTLGIVVGLSALYVHHVNDDCAALGGHTKWLYGRNMNYLCLDPEGRIIG